MASVAAAVPAPTFVVMEPETTPISCTRDAPGSLPAEDLVLLLWPLKASRFLSRLLPSRRSTPRRSRIPPSRRDDTGATSVRPLVSDANVELSPVNVSRVESHALGDVSLAAALSIIGMLSGVTFVGSMSTGIITIGLPRITEDLDLPQSLLLWYVMCLFHCNSIYFVRLVVIITMNIMR